MHPWLRGLLIALVWIGIFAGTFLGARYSLAPTGSERETVRVDIPAGAAAAEIADRLHKAGAIRSTWAFLIMARILGGSTDMKAGEYVIPRSRGVVQIIDQLVAGDAEAQWVVIPEGQTVAQIAILLERRRLVKANEFIRATGRKPKSFGMEIPVSRRSVEGYLMPDTYKFPRQFSERQIIKQLLRNWNQQILRPHRALFARADLPMDKIIIMASMIEREARVPEDRPLIAAVIRNRLKKKMLLQIDATVLYALRRHKKVVTFKDLKVKSPYNTYQNHGLPPGPICNPGAAAVQAALQPAREDYLYYVAQPDGSHIFTRTHEEHKAAIKKIRAMKAATAVAAKKSG